MLGSGKRSAVSLWNNSKNVQYRSRSVGGFWIWTKILSSVKPLCCLPEKDDETYVVLIAEVPIAQWHVVITTSPPSAGRCRQ